MPPASHDRRHGAGRPTAIAGRNTRRAIVGPYATDQARSDSNATGASVQVIGMDTDSVTSCHGHGRPQRRDAAVVSVATVAVGAYEPGSWPVTRWAGH